MKAPYRKLIIPALSELGVCLNCCICVNPYFQLQCWWNHSYFDLKSKLKLKIDR